MLQNYINNSVNEAVEIHILSILFFQHRNFDLLALLFCLLIFLLYLRLVWLVILWLGFYVLLLQNGLDFLFTISLFLLLNVLDFLHAFCFLFLTLLSANSLVLEHT